MLNRQKLIIHMIRLSTEEKDVSEKSKQASSVVNLILPEVNTLNNLTHLTAVLIFVFLDPV